MSSYRVTLSLRKVSLIVLVTSPTVGEKNIPLFDAALDKTLNEETIECQTDQQDNEAISKSHAKSNDQYANQHDDIPAEPIQQMEPIQPEIHQSS